MSAPLGHIRDVIRRAWPHGWTQSGANERLDAPPGSPAGWRPWWSATRYRFNPAGSRRWGGQSHNERLAERQRRRR